MKITGRHLTVTPALRRHVRERFERLEKYGVPTERIQIVLGVIKLQHVAEAVFGLGGKRFQAKVSTREMYVTIDQLVDRLEAQIRKHKDRRTEHKWREPHLPYRKVTAKMDEESIEVVRPKLSRLSRETAKERLDARPGSLMFYTCLNSGKLQVLQRGENGQVVLIDP